MPKHIDLTERLLQVEENPRSEVPWIIRLMAHWLMAVMISLMSLSGATLMYIGYKTSNVETMVGGGIVIAAAIFGATLAASAMQQIQLHRLSELQWSRQMQAGRQVQRPDLVTTLTAAEIERYRAKQAFNA